MPDIFIDQDPEEDKKTHSAASSREGQTEHVTKKTVVLDKEVKEKEYPLTASADKQALLDSLGIKSHGGRIHSFSAYFEDPSRVKFNNKLDEEILLLFLRRHFVTNFPWFVKAFAMSLVPVIFEILGAFSLYSTDFVSLSGKIIIYGFYYFFILSGYVFVNYMTWFYNISLVTSIRIIDIDFSEVVFENVAATKLSQVEDVSYKQIGVFRSIFDYGDVHAQTAGTASNFEFLAVPHPENVIRIVNHLLGRNYHV